MHMRFGDGILVNVNRIHQIYMRFFIHTYIYVHMCVHLYVLHVQNIDIQSTNLEFHKKHFNLIPVVFLSRYYLVICFLILPEMDTIDGL